MRVVQVEHPIIQHKLTILREEGTHRALFRQVVEELGILLGYEASRSLELSTRSIRTPEESATGFNLASPLPVIVPILRAGLGMLKGMEHLIPEAEVGFLGIRRDENTHEPTTYAKRLSRDLTGRHCFILDPMIATGGSMNVAIDFLFERGAAQISVLSIIASPEGIEVVRSANETRNVTVFVASIDRELSANAYILPGLGDAGDRLYGAVDAES
jgi:uracil phosphoribosyltransferase